jgi:uncharacterized protein YkwD
LKRSLIIWAALALAACSVNPMTPPAPPTLPPETSAIYLASVANAGPFATQLSVSSPTSAPLELATVHPAEPAEETVEGVVVTAQVELVAAPTEPAAQPTDVAAKFQAPPPTVEPLVAAGPQAVEVPPTEAPVEAPPAVVVPPVSGDAASAEQYTIDLINLRRSEAGLWPLARNETLMAIARGRVADMVARGYTGHNDPVTGISLGRANMQAAGFGDFVGENWYGSIKGPPAIAEVAMGWFMTDPPHYRNILSSNFVSVGVGIAYNGRQWLLVQDFAGQ